jgi:hypothetical protein
MASFKVGQAPWEQGQAAPSFAVGQAPWEQPQREPGYFERVGSGFVNLGNRVVNDLTAAGTAAMQKGGIEGGLELLRAPLRAVGAVAEGAFLPVVEAPVIKQTLEAAGKAVQEVPGIKELTQSAAKLAEENPTAAQDLFDIVNVATLGTGRALAPLAATEARAVGRDVVRGARVALTPSEETIQRKVVELFNKSIKPTPKKTLAQTERYQTDTLNALRTIKANADSLNIEDGMGELVTRSPQSINELAQAVDQTKKTVFTQYDTIAKEAGTAGAVVDAKPIADEILKVAENKALRLTNPAVVTHAEGWVERLRELDILDAETTQEAIRMMNANLQAFYRNPTYDAASKVTIDAGIANNLRVALDKAIEGATGAQYQVFKRQYAALKAIENDVVRAATREGRKNTKGLIDYTDIFTGGQMLAGLMSLNPAMFTKGAIERGIKEYIKFLNDPNRAVANIFDKLDASRATFTPESATFKSLANPSLGMSMRDVTKYDESGRAIRNIASDSSKGATALNNGGKGGASSPTTPSKPSTAGSISTGSAATGKEGVSARKADTSVPFDGAKSGATQKERFAAGEVTELDKALMAGDRATWRPLSTLKKYSLEDAGLKDPDGPTPEYLTVYRYGNGEIKAGDYVTTDPRYAEQFYKDGRTLLKKEQVPLSDLKAYGDGRVVGKNRYTGKEGVELIYDPSPSIPKELEPLAKEARKYDNVDDFLEAAPREAHVLYHGGLDGTVGDNAFFGDFYNHAKGYADEEGIVTGFVYDPKDVFPVGNKTLQSARRFFADKNIREYLKPIYDAAIKDGRLADAQYQLGIPDKNVVSYVTKILKGDTPYSEIAGTKRNDLLIPLMQELVYKLQGQNIISFKGSDFGGATEYVVRDVSKLTNLTDFYNKVKSASA